MTDLELKIPVEILETLPSGKEAMIRHLSSYFDGVIEKYGSVFEKRVQGGPMAGPLSKYEKSILKDFLLSTTLGRLEETEASRFAAENASA